MCVENVRRWSVGRSPRAVREKLRSKGWITTKASVLALTHPSQATACFYFLLLLSFFSCYPSPSSSRSGCCSSCRSCCRFCCRSRCHSRCCSHFPFCFPSCSNAHALFPPTHIRLLQAPTPTSPFLFPSSSPFCHLLHRVAFS